MDGRVGGQGLRFLGIRRAEIRYVRKGRLENAAKVRD